MITTIQQAKCCSTYHLCYIDYSANLRVSVNPCHNSFTLWNTKSVSSALRRKMVKKWRVITAMSPWQASQTQALTLLSRTRRNKISTTPRKSQIYSSDLKWNFRASFLFSCMLYRESIVFYLTSWIAYIFTNDKLVIKLSLIITVISYFKIKRLQFCVQTWSETTILPHFSQAENFHTLVL